jgi:ribulose-phosphate 3-epimerase
VNPRAERLLTADGVLISPSVLAADFGHLSRHCREAERAGADLLHLDVMDGHFVPNITMGPDIVAAVRRAVDLPLDVHLMVSRPDDYIEPFIKAGADIVGYHIESIGDPGVTADKIRALGAAACLTLNPGTPVTEIEPWLDRVDMVLVMTVQPGFGGQSFQEGQLDKVKAVKAARRLPVVVDGGVVSANAGLCARAGADILVAGTAVFRAPDLAVALADLRVAAKEA